MEVATCFHIFCTGQLEAASFPLGPGGSQIFCKYEVVSGPDWELVAGLPTGITQCASSEHHNAFVFNMPLGFSYKSTNPFGWPQIVFCIYGKNIWGAETSLGYACVHVPISRTEKIRIPICMPRCTGILSEIVSWISGKNPELKCPKILTEGTKNKGLHMDSYGELTISLQTTFRGADRMGYDVGRWRGLENSD